MTRVLILNERDPLHPKAGGAEVHVAEIFRRLVPRGFEVTHLTSTFRGAADEETLDGMQLRRVGALPFYYLRAASVCARESRRGAVDLVSALAGHTSVAEVDVVVSSGQIEPRV